MIRRCLRCRKFRRHWYNGLCMACYVADVRHWQRGDEQPNTDATPSETPHP